MHKVLILAMCLALFAACYGQWGMGYPGMGYGGYGGMRRGGKPAAERAGSLSETASNLRSVT